MSNIIRPDFQSKQEAGTSDKKKVPNYRLHMELAFSSPSIWRSVKIPGNFTLAQLHRVMQSCFNWSDESGHRFLVGKIFYGPILAESSAGDFDEAAVQLHELEEGMGFLFTYLYDAGAGWECEITVEEASVDPLEKRAALISGDQASPPEEFFDIHEFLHFLTRLEASDANERGRLLAEHNLPADFDPGFFDSDELSTTLANL